jgi:hypothetical protein
MTVLLLGLGMAWALPWSVVGLLAGLAGMPGGARAYWSRQECALVFRCWPWGPGGAVTLGNVILVTSHDLEGACLTYAHSAGHCVHPKVRLGDHERAHVYQYMLLGLFFVPVYLACGGVSVRNPLERAADHYAMHGHGWWPWPLRR